MTTITIQAVAYRSEPRIARPIATLAAEVFGKVTGWLRPRPLTRAEEATRLRQLALQFHAQPSFAADLLAAADRHVDESK